MIYLVCPVGTPSGSNSFWCSPLRGAHLQPKRRVSRLVKPRPCVRPGQAVGSESVTNPQVESECAKMRCAQNQRNRKGGDGNHLQSAWWIYKSPPNSLMSTISILKFIESP